MDPPASIDRAARASEDTGVYLTEDNSLRAFVCPSPSRPDAPRPRTEVDWVLPPIAAFNHPSLCFQYSLWLNSDWGFFFIQKLATHCGHLS